MSLSWNEDYFPDDDYWWCQYWNQSIIYINGSEPNPNCLCNATFKADPDIAGVGIIIGFVATGWYTCLIATVAQFCIVTDQIRTFFSDEQPERFYGKTRYILLGFRNWMKRQIKSIVGESSKPLRLLRWIRGFLLQKFDRNHSRLKVFAQILLDSLCDIQIATGAAIIIAAWAQGNGLAFYHEQLAVSYWNLTLNSLWAARAGDMDINSQANIWHIRTRNFAILCNVVLSTAFQAHVIIRETRQWDPFSEGYCYLYNDQSDPKAVWLWVSGLGLYSIYLILYLTSAKRDETGWMDEGSEWFDKKLQKGKKAYLKTCDTVLLGPFDQTQTWEDGHCQWVIVYLLELLSYIPLLFVWLFFQFLALWSYGNSQSLLLVLAYTGFAAWNTYDIIDAKNSNTELVDGSEYEWRFGQVVPVVLLGLIVLSTFDAVERARSRQEEKEITTLVSQVEKASQPEQTQVDSSTMNPGLHRRATNRVNIETLTKILRLVQQEANVSQVAGHSPDTRQSQTWPQEETKSHVHSV